MILRKAIHMDETRVRQIIQEELARFVKLSTYTFDRDVVLQDGKDIQTGNTTGTTIGTDANQKVGFHGSRTTQYAAIAYPVGGSTVDSQARAAVVLILNALRANGTIAT